MQRRDKGFALLIVLWSLVLISLLTTQIIASGRTAMALAGNVRDAARAQAAADGAIDEAIFHLCINGAQQWQADGTTHLLNKGGIPVVVRLTSLAGKINPNLASTALLAGLFQAVGGAPGQARQLAANIIEWRSLPPNKQQKQAWLAAYRHAGLLYGPPGHDFSDLSELADIEGMPPDLLGNALPYMNLFQSGDPNPAQADPVVRRALQLSGQSGNTGTSYSGNTPVVAVQAVAGIKGVLVVRRRAYVSIAGQNGTTPYDVLSLTGY